MITYHFLDEKEARKGKEQIIKLFEKNYTQYHYLHELEKEICADKIKIVVAKDNNELIGIGALKKDSESVLSLTHLLVDKNYRDLGIGKKIDELRFQYYCSDSRYNQIYASCVTNDLKSQILKTKQQMVPIAFRYCYRYNEKSKKFGHSILYFHPKNKLQQREYEITDTKNELLNTLIREELKLLKIRHFKIVYKDRILIQRTNISTTTPGTDYTLNLNTNRIFIDIHSPYFYDMCELLNRIREVKKLKQIIILEVVANNTCLDYIIRNLSDLGFFFCGLDFRNIEEQNNLYITLQYVPEDFLRTIEPGDIHLFGKGKEIKKIVDASRRPSRKLEKEDKLFLTGLINLQSVYPSENVAKTARFIKMHLSRKLGMPAEIKNVQDNCFILAEYEFTEKKGKNILFYAHYDVKPALIKNGWNYPPFELSEFNNKYFGRGIADDKGQLFCFFKALAEIKRAQLPLSGKIRFLLDGGEESGSPGLAKLVEDNKQFFENDLIVICDGSQLNDEELSLGWGTRGQLDARIEIHKSSVPTHPGKIDSDEHAIALKLAKLVEEIQTYVIRQKGQEASEFCPGDEKLFKPSLCFTYIQTGLHDRSLNPVEGAVHFDLRYLKDFNDHDFIQDIGKIARSLDNDFTLKIKQNYPALVQNHTALAAYKNKLSKLGQYISKETCFYNYLGFSLPLSDLVRNKTFLILPLANPNSNNHSVNENLEFKYLQNGIVLCYHLMENILS